MKSLVYFGLGMAIDILVVLYYRFIIRKRIIPAIFTSFIITLTPMFAIRAGIETGSYIFVFYALGAGLGTAIGMKIKF